MKPRKAQSEIVGLVVIVLIITVALLFYVSMSISGDGNSKKTIFRQYTNNELSASFTKAFIDTSVCGTTIDGLIYDCATAGRIRCDGLTSCQQINETLVNITNQTLDAWGYIYDIVITFPDEAKRIEVGTGLCNAGTVGRAPINPYIVPLYPLPGTVRLELGICN
jgi:hypothetical protein